MLDTLRRRNARLALGKLSPLMPTVLNPLIHRPRVSIDHLFHLLPSFLPLSLPSLLSFTSLSLLPLPRLLSLSPSTCLPTPHYFYLIFPSFLLFFPLSFPLSLHFFLFLFLYSPSPSRSPLPFLSPSSSLSFLLTQVGLESEDPQGLIVVSEDLEKAVQMALC